MTQRRSSDETRLLFEAGRRECPSASLLESTLNAVHHASEQLDSVDPAGSGKYRRRLAMAGGLLAAVAGVALFTSGLLADWKQRFTIFDGGSYSNAEQLVPELPVPAESVRNSKASTPGQPALEEVTPGPDHAPEPVAEAAPPRQHQRIDQLLGSPPTAAELIARQRLERELQERQAAAARAKAVDCQPTQCVTVSPSDPLISDFEDISSEGVFVDRDAYSAKPADWWQRFYGSTYVYPSDPTHLSQTVRGQWRISGTVRQPSGFGLWLGACSVDFSEYRGFSFELSGTAGPSQALTLIVDTDPNSVPERCRNNVGSCNTTEGPCISPSKKIQVRELPGTQVVVLWDELRGGQPRPSPDPARILQLRWAFDWPSQDPEQAVYSVDLSIDNVRLLR